MANQRILVIGGTGFIGTPLVKKLINLGHDIALLVQKSGFLGEFSDCKYFTGDLLDREGLMQSINDFDLVVNLAAIVKTTNKKKYQENIDGTKNLIEVLEKKGIKKLIHFSTQNVTLKTKGPYAKSKEESEKIIRNSNLEYLIIRPNYVYAINRNNDFYMLAVLISKFRIAPVIGSGNCKIQPVLREDLVDVVINFIENFIPRSIVEISGKETVSINEITDLIGEYLGIKPLKIHIPFFILKTVKGFISFDVDGYTESRISQNPFSNYNYSSFRDNLKKIIDLLK